MNREEAEAGIPAPARHPLLVLTALALAGVLLIALFTSYQSRALMEATALQNAALYSEAIAEFRTLYTSEVVETVRAQGVTVAHDYKDRPGAIPLPATLSMILGERIGTHRSGAHTKLYSAYPFPWRKQDHDRQFEDPFAQRAWEELSQDPSKPYHAFEEVDGHPVLRFATPDRMRPSCIGCHNTHPDSPKRDWALGDVRGVLEVVLPLDESVRQTESTAQLTLALLVVLAAIGLGVLGAGLQTLRRNALELTESVRLAREATGRAELARQRAEDLARSNLDLEQFAYVASHDLREPLRKIRQFGELLESEAGRDLGERATGYLSRMTGAAGRMDRLISDLLAFARVGSASASFQNVDLGAIAAEVLDDLQLQIADADGRVDLEALPTVQADPTQMRILLQNLIGNALKFQRRDVPPLVRVAAVRSEADGEPVDEISVADNGIGFDESFTERVFEIFGRLHGRSEYPGTGIGLAICKKIVERHGGTLSVKSTRGEGACFTFSLPIRS
jgi:signal transduction histidine kinase